MPQKLINIVGRKYNFLTVIDRKMDKSGVNSLWLCKCDCGNEKWIYRQHLANNSTKSCGCYRKKIMAELRTTHGLSKTREYRSYHNMKNRCFKKTNDAYYRYGGRGITICERWLDSFENFYKDMGGMPKGGSIDRIDNDGNYEPDNCRWATITQQNNNRRKTNIGWSKKYNSCISCETTKRKHASKGLCFYCYNKKYYSRPTV